jgi:hypothetical protein
MKSSEEKKEAKKKMKSTCAGCITAMALWAALTTSVPVSAQEQSNHNRNLNPAFIEFNAPGAGKGAYQGTAAFDINAEGEAVGPYILANNSFRAFVRHPNGKFTTFTAAGAGARANQGTLAYSINSRGEIAGYFIDRNNVNHGYLRSADGTVTTIDVPGAGAGAGQGTLAFNINSEEEIAGYYVDGNDVYHGFVLFPGPGRFTSFDAPGAGTGPGQGTQTATEDGLSRNGSVAGAYIDGSDVVHGLVFLTDGTMTEFDVTGAGTSAYQGTYPGGIDPKNTITGYYVDGDNVYHGFQRRKDGAVTTFDVPGAGTAPGQGTQGENISASGIDGQYIDGNNVYHSFVYYYGTISTFDAPGAGTAPGQGTFIGGPIIAYGQRGHPLGEEFAGYYVDQNNVLHGYLATIPPPPGAVDAAR